jgi:hypothetical protein
MQNRNPSPSALEIVGTLASIAAVILAILILGA